MKFKELKKVNKVIVDCGSFYTDNQLISFFRKFEEFGIIFNEVKDNMKNHKYFYMTACNCEEMKVLSIGFTDNVEDCPDREVIKISQFTYIFRSDAWNQINAIHNSRFTDNNVGAINKINGIFLDCEDDVAYAKAVITCLKANVEIDKYSKVVENVFSLTSSPIARECGELIESMTGESHLGFIEIELPNGKYEELNFNIWMDGTFVYERDGEYRVGYEGSSVFSDTRIQNCSVNEDVHYPIAKKVDDIISSISVIPCLFDIDKNGTTGNDEHFYLTVKEFACAVERQSFLAEKAAPEFFKEYLKLLSIINLEFTLAQ